MEHNTVFYNEIKNELRTGDLILFHGMLISSEINELLTGSHWSHVGMVVRPEDLGIKSTDKLLLWESNTLVNLEDVELNKTKIGPMLVDLEQRLITDLKDKKDNIFQIRYNTCDITEDMILKLKAFIEKVHLDTFPKTEFDLKKEVFEGRILGKAVDNGDYFCSKLISDTYIHMGILSEKYPPNSYEPKDFSNAGSLPFIKRGQLVDGPQIDVSEK
ncbi:hypothetical protein [Clostridium manihotivorum]|uniref:Permuted papain-like amidase enzyme, YaeF/YiiX, C92 family n=1 Tax=Clostridium manihotivorum TaxID=2320868 RepID=A0A3R5X1N2_9CLOT|nr:hypothetical protein [Clostridium manihotivorum]QAA32137.1 hypothetical protein C1I91_10995 [Clostridium manihotivorum]